MISSSNPVKGTLNPETINREGLVPQRYDLTNGRPVYLFFDKHIDIVRIDFIFDCGTAHQDKFLQTASAIRLLTAGTSRHTARQIAEFVDFRGIVFDSRCDSVSSSLTVYCLSRYLVEFLPLLQECLVDASYPQEEFDIFVSKRRQALETAALKPSHVARCNFYKGLYGSSHPLGRFATVDDVDRLSVEDTRRYYRQYLVPSRMTILLGGNVPEGTLDLIDKLFGSAVTEPYQPLSLPTPQPDEEREIRLPMPNAVQSALRVGCLLPFCWSDVEYARFMVLNTVLGGYFGSRLMTNIREDKGYTYGIYSQTQIYRGSMAFYIFSEVAASKADAALQEIRNEIDRLCNEPVGIDELQMVQSSMVGDFIRGIDGVFERMERFSNMFACGVTELFTDNLLGVIKQGGISPSELLETAQRVLSYDNMLVVSAGPMA